MTPLETLAKYGLKTDVKSIRERVFLNVEKRFSYSEFLIKWLQNIHGVHVQIPIDSDFRHAWEEIKNADLALLCSLAEKGERRSNPLNPNIKMTVQEAWAQVSDEAEPYVIYECLDTISKAIEKGERYEKAVKKELENAQSFIKFDGQKGQASAIEYLLKAIITEAEGE